MSIGWTINPRTNSIQELDVIKYGLSDEQKARIAALPSIRFGLYYSAEEDRLLLFTPPGFMLMQSDFANALKIEEETVIYRSLTSLPEGYVWIGEF